MEDISLHILDIAENSVNAGATLIQIRLTENSERDLLIIEIEDNGRGIPREHVAEILDPFYTTRTTRKIGLGLSFLSQSAKETGGDVVIRSDEGKGTLVRAEFKPRHIDMKPVGDLTQTIIVLIAGNPEIDFTFSFSGLYGSYSLDTREIRAALADVPINSPDVIAAIQDNIKTSLNEIRKEVE